MAEDNTAPRTPNMPTAPNIPQALHKALAAEAARRGQPIEVLLCDAIRRELLRMGRADTGAGSDATHNHRYKRVKRLVQQGKLSPTTQELTDTLSMSRTTAQRYLVALQEEGIVERTRPGYLPRGCQRRVQWLEPECNDGLRTQAEGKAPLCTSASTPADRSTGGADADLEEPTDQRYEEAKHLVLSGAVAPRYRDLKLALHVGQQAVQRYLRAMLHEGLLARCGRHWTVRTRQAVMDGAAVAR